MAYVEIWKSGKLITCLRVDEQKARKGCRIRLGSAGEVHLSIGRSEILGKFEVRMFEGEPPQDRLEQEQNASIPHRVHQSPKPLDFSVGTPDFSRDNADHPPEIEGYQIIERLGEGGMGTVWRAEQLSTRRQVALKMMSSSRFFSNKAQARFEREVELTARLDHPNIASLFDSGLHHGMYYYAMEFIDGLPLDQYVIQKALTQKQILVLMRTVCEAIEHAHLRGVMHRDLKPSNIMVSFDGQPHVVDFGLARTFLEEDSETLTISVEGEVAGTPAYMSPEQAAGHHDQVDTRTDVYSLGVILYRLLTGQSPYDLSGSLFDVLQRVVQGKIRPPRETCPTIDRELEAVLLKAIAHNQEERYPSAGALAEDIDNYLNDEPLDARIPTTLYFLCKKARKYRVQVGIALVVLITVFGIALLAYAKVIGEQTRRQVAEEQAETQTVELELKSEKLTWAELRMKVLGDDKQEAEAALNLLQEAYTTAQDEVSQLNHRLGERKAPVDVRRIDLSSGEPLTSTALVRKPSLPSGIQSWTLETRGHRSGITRLVFSPNGKTLASAGVDNIIRLWDAKSGQLTQILIDPNVSTNLPWFSEGGGRDQFSWSADQSAQTFSEIIPLWAINLPNTWQSFQRTVTAAALSPDRTLLVLGDHNGTIRMIDRQSGQTQYTHPAAWCGPIQSLGFSPNGRVLATCTGTGTVCLWDAHRWEPLRQFESISLTGNSASVESMMAWAPDSIAVARIDNERHLIEILDSQSGVRMRELPAGPDVITSSSWSPDGKLIAAGISNGTVCMWDIESDSNEPLAALSAHTGRVNALVWQSEDQSLITAGEDGKIEIWHPRSRMRTRSLQVSQYPVTCLAFSPHGKYFASGGDDGIIRLWTTGENWSSTLLRSDPNEPQDRPSRFTAVTWSPDEMLLATGDSVGEITIWDPKSHQSIRSIISHCPSISSLVWSPDGRQLLCGGADGIVRIFDAKKNFEEHVVLLPLWDQIGPGLAINAAGDYRGPPKIADHLFYIPQTSEAQMTLSQADFKSQYGWINEPWQVGLYKPGDEKVERIYVNAKSEGPYDGKTWATAFNDLQDALSIAQPNTEIWVATGTYKPDRGTRDRSASFHLKNGVRLIGGFSGTEVSTYQRDPNNNQTILSGDLKGNDGSDFIRNEENSYHVVAAIRTDSDTVLDGFYISGGNANGSGEFRYDEGGGLYNVDGGMTLINCTFRYNTSTRPGAGMYHSSGRSTLILTGCVFRKNRAKVKEGHDWGGGIHIGGATGTMSHCTFEDNVASSGGGVFLCNTVDFVLKDCTFIGNRATGSGGAILAWAEDIYSLINCRFVRNSGWFHSGAVANEGDSKTTLANCIFIGNSAKHGAGGMSHFPGRFGSGFARLTNCTFVGNSTDAEAGGGFYGGGEHSATLSNCIVWSNTCRGDSLESAQICGDGIVLDHSCIQSWSDELGGVGNFGINPMFVDPNGPDGKIGSADDDLRLSPGSPCINKGDIAAIPADALDLDGDGDVNEPIPFDLDGKPRIQNGTVDIGAYESG
ncbi:MAG: protein kinase [Sedimentisphaerales bacterium]|nr:protein kinase [Sedimentisphaerales bacterium]